MKRTIEAKPEQAMQMIQLFAAVEKAKADRDLGVRMLLAGVVPEGTKVLAVSPTGHMVVATPDEPQPSPQTASKTGKRKKRKR